MLRHLYASFHFDELRGYVLVDVALSQIKSGLEFMF